MKKFNVSLLTGALLASSAVFAQTTAITNATVHTMTEAGVLEGATVVIENGTITAVNPGNVSADKTIDAQGRVLTPGFIGSMNQLGLVEVSAVAGSRDGGDDKAGIDFDASPAFNPRSSLIPYGRKGGITQNVVIPHGGKSIFEGLAFVVDLSGEFNSVLKTNTALVIDMDASGSGSRAMKYKTLTEKLEAQQEKLAKGKKDDKKDAKKPSREEQVLTAVLKGEIPVVAEVERASDILEVLKVKEQFDLKLVLWGVNDAVLVKDEIAKANVPVVISAVSNLPTSFSSLHADLTNAGKLERAGVKVLLSGFAFEGAHNLYQLRFDAGIAVAHGMTHEGALKAVTSNIADTFGLDGGKIASGQRADLVLWSADPFEFSTTLDKLWINGEEVSTESRHDKLRERYTTDSDMPRAYTK
ncbi:MULTISPECIES: amidohydrolase family protein [unclassified Pseudoalteromonas]|uniref:amidohydrolase family protein n=1 Tax=unclassified Pseudoalteromonas TaxID=194690 RepID=UPI002097A9A9|nr:amidohydrolase family protein [Pseudoalteromonas sp. XMcav2-N]MCO7187694.1 amidohydrolase family protein [Pseudoalteromonas sp. XMcav2-N]